MYIYDVLYRYPAQEHVSGSSKIPTVLYYDKEGAVRAVGAETLAEGIYERAKEEGWIKVEWSVRSFQTTGDPLNEL